MAGARGSRRRVAMVEIARGAVNCMEGRRHGAVPAMLLGAMVRVIA